MTENRENWLYSGASGLYFQHDGFVMRASDGKQSLKTTIGVRASNVR